VDQQLMARFYEPFPYVQHTAKENRMKFSREISEPGRHFLVGYPHAAGKQYRSGGNKRVSR
jgi:hypothetical protein